MPHVMANIPLLLQTSVKHIQTLAIAKVVIKGYKKVVLHRTKFIHCTTKAGVRRKSLLVENMLGDTVSLSENQNSVPSNSFGCNVTFTLMLHFS